jgi:hypothetical protein
MRCGASGFGGRLSRWWDAAGKPPGCRSSKKEPRREAGIFSFSKRSLCTSPTGMDLLMREFPKILEYVHGRYQRRRVVGKPSVTATLTLDDNGNRRSQCGSGGWHGVYFWNGKAWELDAVYTSAQAAWRAAACIRRSLPSNRFDEKPDFRFL